jgi:hypothetical protein
VGRKGGQSGANGGPVISKSAPEPAGARTRPSRGTGPGKHHTTKLGPAYVSDGGRRTPRGAVIWRAGSGPCPPVLIRRCRLDADGSSGGARRALSGTSATSPAPTWRPARGHSAVIDRPARGRCAAPRGRKRAAPEVYERSSRGGTAVVTTQHAERAVMGCVKCCSAWMRQTCSKAAILPLTAIATSHVRVQRGPDRRDLGALHAAHLASMRGAVSGTGPTP